MNSPLGLAEDKRVTLVHPAQAVFVAGSAEMLVGAVRNLVENAIRHGAPGTAVGVEVKAPGTISIKDRGPGIKAANRDLIFQGFGDRIAMIRGIPASG